MNNKVILKIGLIFMVIFSFFWLFVFGPFYDSIPIQLIVFSLVCCLDSPEVHVYTIEINNLSKPLGRKNKCYKQNYAKVDSAVN